MNCANSATHPARPVNRKGVHADFGRLANSTRSLKPGYQSHTQKIINPHQSFARTFAVTFASAYWKTKQLRPQAAKNRAIAQYRSQVPLGHLTSSFDGGREAEYKTVFILLCSALLCTSCCCNASSYSNFAGFHWLLFQCDFPGVTCEVRHQSKFRTLFVQLASCLNTQPFRHM